MATYSDVILADSPVAYYRLGEPSGHYSDSVAGGLASTAEGSHTRGATGALLAGDDGATHFSGSGTAIDFPDQNKLDLGESPLTLELWVNLDTHKDFNTLLAKGTNAYQISTNASGQVLLVKCGIETIFYSSVIPNTGQWYHLVWSRSGTGPSDNHLYINSYEDTAKTGVGGVSLSDTTRELTIGYEGPAGEFTDGLIDEVALYNTVLSQGRITAHYETGKASRVSVLSLGRTP